MFEPSLIYQLVSLAIVDAVNPCALAVMAMVLMALLLRDPTKKRQVLLGRLMFSLAVLFYILYMVLLLCNFSKM